MHLFAANAKVQPGQHQESQARMVFEETAAAEAAQTLGGRRKGWGNSVSQGNRANEKTVGGGEGGADEKEEEELTIRRAVLPDLLTSLGASLDSSLADSMAHQGVGGMNGRVGWQEFMRAFKSVKPPNALQVLKRSQGRAKKAKYGQSGETDHDVIFWGIDFSGFKKVLQQLAIASSPDDDGYYFSVRAKARAAETSMLLSMAPLAFNICETGIVGTQTDFGKQLLSSTASSRLVEYETALRHLYVYYVYQHYSGEKLDLEDAAEFMRSERESEVLWREVLSSGWEMPFICFFRYAD
jgi:hypothetical protein